MEEGDAPHRYSQAVTQAVECIRHGGLVKVVLARRAAVAFDAEPSAAAVLARLGARHPDCVRYAWHSGGKTWLGATPETLVRVDGRTLHTDALAGTRASERAAELLVSVKERHEHAVVVDAIRRAIASLTEALPPPRSRSSARCADWRICTPPSRRRCARGSTSCAWCVRCTLLRPCAACPAERAAALIAVLETEPRGLYAGPFLRLASNGDGHAVVSLRGAVLAGHVAVVPAGAGIVDGSDGDAELAETRVKQNTVLDALRGEP